MDRDEARDLLAAYALGALPEEERQELLALLRDWPEGRRELAQLLSTADALAAAPAEQPTPALRLEGRIITHAREERSAEQAQRRARRHWPLWRRWLPHAVAAASAAVAVAFGVLLFSDDDGEPAGRWLPVEAGPAADVGASESAGWVYVTDYAGAPVGLLFQAIPPTPQGKSYRLWRLLDGGGIARDQAFQVRGEEFVALALSTREDEHVVGFAVSLEDSERPSPGPPSLDEIRFSVTLD